MKKFLKDLIDAKSKSGAKDYYFFILASDVLCFVTIVLGYSSFTVRMTTPTLPHLKLRIF